jgi:hypothetical protein
MALDVADCGSASALSGGFAPPLSGIGLSSRLGFVASFDWVKCLAPADRVELAELADFVPNCSV